MSGLERPAGRGTPRIGSVKYLNARPLVFGWPDKLVFDHPSVLCPALARGDLDVALVSSFEFLRNPIYRIVDDLAIGSDGPVYSVIVAHSAKISDLTEIELDPAAETSVNLLRCLLGELGLRPEIIPPTNSPLNRATGRLLIGDQAIDFRQRDKSGLKFWDLGEQWKKLTGLPFVYALWLVRPEVKNADKIAHALRQLRDGNLANVDRFIADQAEPEFCRRYFRDHLRFHFGNEEKQGLRRFHDLSVKHGLIERRDFKLDPV